MSSDGTVRSLPQLQERSFDPRDRRWEVTPTAYRVVFWGSAPGGMFLASGEAMAAAYGTEVTGAHDVEDVLTWAAARAKGRPYTIYAIVDNVPGGGGIVQLYGSDPTRNP